MEPYRSIYQLASDNMIRITMPHMMVGLRLGGRVLVVCMYHWTNVLPSTLVRIDGYYYEYVPGYVWCPNREFIQMLTSPLRTRTYVQKFSKYLVITFLDI